MKKIICILICFCLTFNFAFAQSRKLVSAPMELVVEVPKADPGKTWNLLTEKLHQLPGVAVEGYCLMQNLLYIKLNPEQYFNVLVAINSAGYKYYLMRNFNVVQGIEACSNKNNLFLRESSSIY